MSVILYNPQKYVWKKCLKNPDRHYWFMRKKRSQGPQSEWLILHKEYSFPLRISSFFVQCRYFGLIFTTVLNHILLCSPDAGPGFSKNRVYVTNDFVTNSFLTNSKMLISNITKVFFPKKSKTFLPQQSLFCWHEK